MNKSKFFCSLVGGIILGAAVTTVVTQTSGYGRLKRHIKSEIEKIKIRMEEKVKQAETAMEQAVAQEGEGATDRENNNESCNCPQNS